jgi:hypothetical protein
MARARFPALSDRTRRNPGILGDAAPGIDAYIEATRTAPPLTRNLSDETRGNGFDAWFLNVGPWTLGGLPSPTTRDLSLLRLKSVTSVTSLIINDLATTPPPNHPRLQHQTPRHPMSVAETHRGFCRSTLSNQKPEPIARQRSSIVHSPFTTTSLVV